MIVDLAVYIAVCIGEAVGKEQAASASCIWERLWKSWIFRQYGPLNGFHTKNYFYDQELHASNGAQILDLSPLKLLVPYEPDSFDL